MDTHQTVSLKTLAEIIFFRFSRCPFFLSLIMPNHSVSYLLIITTTEIRQPLMDSSANLNPIILKSFSSQRYSVCRLDRGRADTVHFQISTCGLA